MQSKARLFVGAILLLSCVLFFVRQPKQAEVVGLRDPGPAAVPANQAPRFLAEAAAPDYARVGQDFEYQPKVSDPEGDALTFTVANLPTWARFDPVTGRIWGRPSTTHVGTYEGVSISVSDGRHPPASQVFDLPVIGPTTGVARLEWPEPVSKVDGSLLDDLAGFRILYGRDPEDLDHSVWIPDPTARSYSFATLEEGAWYFSIVAVNTAGLEGPPTMPARKII